MDVKLFLQKNPNINLQFVKHNSSLLLSELLNNFDSSIKQKPKIQYIGGANFDNIGDKGLYECFKSIFSDCDIIFKNCEYPLTRKMADDEIDRVKKNKWTDEQIKNKIDTLNKHVMTIDSDVDLVVLVGGTSPPIWISFISHLLDDNIPCALYGTCFTQSFSYYDNNSNQSYKIALFNYPKIHYYINNIYNNAKVIAVRDIRTKEIFHEYCNDSSKIIIVGDPVMVCSRSKFDYNTVTPSGSINSITYESTLTRGKYSLLEKSVCGLALGSEWKTNITLEEKIEYYKDILNYLKTKFNTIRLLSFSKADYIFNSNLVKEIDGIELFNEYSNYWLICKEMKTHSIFIGERLHSIIIATSLGLPTISLSYHDKCRSYMKSIDMEKWVLELGSKEFKPLLDNLLIEAKTITMTLDGSIGYYQTKLYETSRYIVDVILSGYNNNVLRILNNSISWAIKGIIFDKYGIIDNNTLKLYIDENKLHCDFNLYNSIENSLPVGYINASKYVTKYYDSNLNIISNGSIDTEILEETNNLSSYVIHLEDGYCSQKTKLNGYAGYNMFVDKNGFMLDNYLWYFGPCCWTWHHNKWRQHHLRQFTSYTYFDCKVVCLLSNNNYGHWLHDIVASIHLIELENIGKHKIYLNSSNKKEYIMSCLYKLGYTDDDIILGEEVPLIKAKHLYLPVQQPRQVNWMKEWNRAKFRDIVPEQIASKRIYIGRNMDSHRRILNEHQLMTMLEKYNFEYVPTIRDLTLADTIKLFKQCEIVLMSHGANCMNTHWCNDKAYVVYITNEKLKAYHGYFTGCYTNDHINFLEYVGDWTDFDRKAYSELYNVPIEDSYEHWTSNKENTFPTKVITYDDKWDMTINIEEFETFLKKNISII
jgi:hypothetical protein